MLDIEEYSDLEIYRLSATHPLNLCTVCASLNCTHRNM